jgi:hypothetical protein
MIVVDFWVSRELADFWGRRFIADKELQTVVSPALDENYHTILLYCLAGEQILLKTEF